MFVEGNYKFSHADVAKLADALDLGSSPKGWGFKSSHPHQEIVQFELSFFYMIGKRDSHEIKN